jgi:tetratricopeptide (TPR) repeat protein
MIIFVAGCISKSSSNQQSVEDKYYNLGIQKYKSNDYEAAISCFNKVISENPDSDASYWYIGRCYFKLKNYDKAKEYFKKAADVKPDEGWYWYWLGVATYFNESHGGTDQFGNKYISPGSKEADRYFKTAVQFNPNDTVLIKHIADFYDNAWVDDKAAEYYGKYLELQHNDTEVAKKVISYYFDHGDYQKALYYLKLINKYNPNDAYERSIKNLEQGRHEIMFPDGSSRYHDY